MARRYINMKGITIGRLKVISLAGRNLNNRNGAFWLCECSCGNKKNINGGDLRAGRIKSCGCYQKEVAINNLAKHMEKVYKNMKPKKPKKKHKKFHGFTGTRFYKIWKNMIKRCNNPNCVSYHLYMGKGIKVCKRWIDFKNFKEDMYYNYLQHSDKYTERDTTIDRIDNNKDYKPSNCRWSTYKTQARNTNRNVFFEYNGEKKCISAWAEEYNIKYQALRDRLMALKWPIEKALNTPVQIQISRE